MPQGKADRNGRHRHVQYVQAKEELEKLRLEYKDLGTASLMKEYLRNIYKIADSVSTARKAFMLWCEKAEVSAVNCLKQMAKTIRKRIDGLHLPFGSTTGSLEGVVTKTLNLFSMCQV